MSYSLLIQYFSDIQSLADTQVSFDQPPVYLIYFSKIAPRLQTLSESTFPISIYLCSLKTWSIGTPLKLILTTISVRSVLSGTDL